MCMSVQLNWNWEERCLWRLSIRNIYHNHRPTEIQHGRGKVSRDAQFQRTKELSQAHIPPKQILNHLRYENPNIQTTLRQLYNATANIRVEELDGKTVVRHFMWDNYNFCLCVYDLK